MPIKNVVFDVGNVLVKWDPLSILQTAFPDAADLNSLLQSIFRNNIWYDLNLGKCSELEAIDKYHKALNLEKDSLANLLTIAKNSLTPLEETLSIVKRLHQAKFPLYIITDNIHEFMSYLKQRYHFWDMFRGIVVSAEIGHLKPSPFIYQYLLETYQLKPEETVFFDDVKNNVEGAKAVNMFSFQFVGAEKCLKDLKELGIAI